MSMLEIHLQFVFSLLCYSLTLTLCSSS